MLTLNAHIKTTYLTYFLACTQQKSCWEGKRGKESEKERDCVCVCVC